MKNKLNQVRMDYLYRNEWKTKDMTMDELWQQVKASQAVCSPNVLHQCQAHPVCLNSESAPTLIG
jgi:hypothetical protein